ncbi:pentatricopeptide repeat-containing protein [Pyrus ussuriensis x Pyrus communis]|uniref:Pentatricopeptide repeat-containing protein n=1 Tax=Pyrus ussuriensis x Pyrus communis TaxID=2448454 RepID=A0A5N5F4E1_9ROSA|nr:pentatricopeptide repeat-containing protein [Pyrus ussuriensis x Pyrus communis]
MHVYKVQAHFEADQYLSETLPDRKNHVLRTVMLTGYSQNASALVLEHSFGAQGHRYNVQSDFGANVFVQSSLVDMYVKCGDRSGAKKALRSMEADDESLKFYDQIQMICLEPCWSSSMSRVYGIQAGPEHYACMIDLLGRSWELNEADMEMYGRTLLTACRVHGNIELGERAATNLSKLAPLNDVPCVQLSDMCSAAAGWEDAARI